MNKLIALIILCLPCVAGAVDFDIRDAREFAKCVPADAKLEKIAGDLGFTEGCQWNPRDGIRCDRAGRLWCTGNGGVMILHPDGKLIGIILTPEPPTNCCFGDDDMQTLFITARPTVYAIHVSAKGIR